MTVLDWVMILILAVLVVLLLLCIVNILTIPVLRKRKKQNGDVLVSVLIPARNEEQNIGNCVESVIRQSYRNLEVIVLNDGSTDRTREIVCSVNDSRLRVSDGLPLPQGWVGKNFACHQLHGMANGSYLLFIDADTKLEEDCISSALEFSLEHSCDLLSVMPYEISESFWEKLVIPMLYFAVTVFLPFPMISRSPKKQYAMGNGQFMMFRRSFYDSIGGHESLKNRIVEDVWLARRVKEFKGKLVFADANELISCRMYRNLKEVWEGFSKNIFAGLSFSELGLLMTVVIYLALFVIPPALLISGVIAPSAVSVSVVMIPALMRILQAVKFRQPLLFSFLNPLSALFISAVALNSFRLVRFNGGATWKGRMYAEDTISA